MNWLYRGLILTFGLENAGWEELTDTILHAPAEQVFKITEESISLELPFVGHVFQYKTCSGCGETHF